VSYNLYDGLSPGLRFHNKTLLDKPFNYDVNPIYSPNTQSMIGSASLGFNHYNRESRWYNTRYGISGNYYHYAPDAAYLKINPYLNFAIRDADFRDNRRQGFNLRYNIVHKDQSKIVKDSTDDNYSVFSLRYYNSKQEITNTVTFNSDVQLSDAFGKAAFEIQYRKLFDNNRQVNLRVYGGTFLYDGKLTSDGYNFGVSKPNDYLFRIQFVWTFRNLRIFSQQYIQAEGGFKSLLQPENANQWLVSTNVSASIWNWIEVYGDIGLAKNKGIDAKFLYDSGLRLNLVPDYFELYLPVYSNNGWEIAQPQYAKKIRMVVTFSPKTLINLFTRKWF
jgi:hypothetical protein